MADNMSQNSSLSKEKLKYNNAVHRTTSETVRLCDDTIHTVERKKTPSFQITSVTVATRVSNDGGDDSADDLDDSRTDDISEVIDTSRVTDLETPSFSEESFSKEDVFFNTTAALGTAPVIPTSSQYGLAIVANVEGDGTVLNSSGGCTSSLSGGDVHVSVTEAGNVLNIMGAVKQHESENVHTHPGRNERFKVVKIESTEPFKRGRWMCMDYLDHTALQQQTQHSPVNVVKASDSSDVTVSSATQFVPDSGVVLSDGVGEENATNVGDHPVVNMVAPMSSPEQLQGMISQQRHHVANPIPISQHPPTSFQSIVPGQSLPHVGVAGGQQHVPLPVQGMPQQITQNYQQPTQNITATQPQQIMQQQQHAQSMTQIPFQQPAAGNVITPQQQAPQHTSLPQQQMQHVLASAAMQQQMPMMQQSQQQPQYQQQSMQAMQIQQSLQQQQQQQTLLQQQQLLHQQQTQQQQHLMQQQTQQQQTQQQQAQQQHLLQQQAQQQQQLQLQQQKLQQQQQLQQQSLNQQMQQQQLQQQHQMAAAVIQQQHQQALSQVQNQQPSIPVQPPGQSAPQHQVVQQTQPQHTQQSQYYPNLQGNQVPMPAPQPQQTVVTMQAPQTNMSQPQQNQFPSQTQQPSVQSSTHIQNIPPQSAQIQQQAQSLPAQIPASQPSQHQQGITQLPPQQNATTQQLNVAQQQIIVNASQPQSVPASLHPSQPPTTAQQQQHFPIVSNASSQPFSNPTVSAPSSVLSPHTGAATASTSSVTNVVDPVSGGIVNNPVDIQCLTSGQTASAPVSLSGGGSSVALLESLVEAAASADEATPGTEDTESASGTNAVAIDNKIEQAMDLVKSHLMFAVREEVEVLKEKIAELMDRINQLEQENSILKAHASQETLAQLSANSSQSQQSQATSSTTVQQGQHSNGSG